MKRKTFLSTLSAIPMFNSLNTLDGLLEGQKTEKMPVLFLGHGSPMNAIEDNIFTQKIKEIGKTIPKPSAVLCVSAHWLTRGTHFTAMQNPRTIHDFGGFPQELFNVQYPAPGNKKLAEESQTLLKPIEAGLDLEWGLDHGAWSVLVHLFPKSDVPVVQMSIDYNKPAAYHFELSKKLQSLRNKGVLIIGSGNIIHNLGMADFRNIAKPNHGFDWAKEAQLSINKHILEQNMAPLLAFNSQSAAYNLSIPTPDHYYPLLYCLGLREKSDKLEIFNDLLVAGSLSMTSLKIG